jgi:hypothetical protein
VQNSSRHRPLRALNLDAELGRLRRTGKGSVGQFELSPELGSNPQGSWMVVGSTGTAFARTIISGANRTAILSGAD